MNELEGRFEAARHSEPTLRTVSASAFAAFWRKFRRNPSSLFGLGLVGLLVTVAVLAPVIAPYPDDVLGKVRLEHFLEAPSRDYPFGTDEVGRDILTLVVYGTRVSISITFQVVLVAAGIGVPLGALSGFFGGRVQSTIMGLTDVFLAIPGLVLAISIAAVFGPGLRNMLFAVALVWWPGYARLVHSQVLAAKEEPYVEAARAMGASSLRILLRHILWNSVSPLIVKVSLDMGFVMLVAASLGFIGIGAQPPVPEWGAMISVARRYILGAWWYAFFPGLAIFLTVLGFNLMGDGLRDALDPKSR